LNTIRFLAARLHKIDHVLMNRKMSFSYSWCLIFQRTVIHIYLVVAKVRTRLSVSTNWKKYKDMKFGIWVRMKQYKIEWRPCMSYLQGITVNCRPKVKEHIAVTHKKCVIMEKLPIFLSEL
jgi:hypothetical protein